MSALHIAIDKLKATGGVTAIVGAKGIYPIQLPQTATLPCLEINIVGGSDQHMLTGAGGYYEHRVSIRCFAADALGVIDLGNAVLAALQDNINVTIGSFSGVNTRWADLDFTEVSDERQTAMRVLDFYIRWRN